MPTLKQREKLCRSVNTELASALSWQDYRRELGQDTGSKIALQPVDRRGKAIWDRAIIDRESPFFGERMRAFRESCLIYNSDKNQSHTGDWMKKETVRLEKPIGNLFTMDYESLVLRSESKQSPQNTAANDAKWRNRGRVASKEQRAYKAVVTGAMVKASERSDTGALQDANERTSGDYRKYFR